MKVRYYALIFSSLNLFGCKDESDSEKPDPVQISVGEMMLVSNEGNFQWGNASASLVNLSGNKTWEDAFKLQNNRALGDVFQSATQLGNEWWLVMNNSGKIETVNATDFKSSSTISGFTSPRYALQISANQVLVSDIYASGISVVDIQTKAKTGFIPLSGWTEEMILEGNEVWIVSKAKPLIYILNTSSLSLIDSISLPGKGTSIGKGPSGKAWLGYSGDDLHAGGVLLVDVASKAILNSWVTSENNRIPDRFETSETGDSLFFIDKGIYLLSATKNGFVPIELVNQSEGNWYGLGFDQKHEILYISDAKDYVQKSTIRVLDLKTGLRKRDLKVGVGTGHFYFF